MWGSLCGCDMSKARNTRKPKRLFRGKVSRASSMLSYRLACEDAKVEMIRHEVPFHTGVP